MAWNPFGVSLEISATGSVVNRISATQYTVIINAAWETYYSGAKTNYGMTVSSGGVTKTLNPFGTFSSGNSATFTGTYSITDTNGAATKTVTVTFRNFNSDNGNSATKTVSFNVTVPTWTWYSVIYNANGGTGAPATQTKWKDQTLKLSTTQPTRTGYTFLGWDTNSTATSVTYAAGANYTANAADVLYAVWKANTYTVSYNANGGTGAPASQTKTYDQTLKLSATKPTRENYNFLGWGTSASATTVIYAAGANYTANAAITLYAIWELAYTKPRISNLVVDRCDEAGDLASDGTFASVSFNWACDKDVTSIKIYWDYGEATVTASGKVGGNTAIIGGGLFSTERTYKITVEVADASGSTKAHGSVFGQKYIIDFSSDGVAFGKTAELYKTADFAYDAKFNGAVYGRALGLDRLPEPESTDFNECLTTGCYAVHGNAAAATYSNIPIARAGRLEVWSATGEGVRAEQWSYLRQRYIPYNSENAVWERDITRGEDNVWHFYEWYRSSLTPNASDKIYNKSAVTVCLTENVTSLTTGAYTKIAFNKTLSAMGNKLSLSDNSVLIGAGVDYVKASAQILLKCLARGSKHFKINKVSNGTTTSFSWICQETDPITNASGAATATGIEFCMPSIIIPVKSGDYITCTYYTSNSTDYIVAGSTAGGAQTYFTVEEL